MQRWNFTLVAMFWLLAPAMGFSAANSVPAKPLIFSAEITKVEGKGVANVRRKSGITTVAGQGLKLFAGDKVITDTASQVHLLLVDGTLIKIGMSSEYKFEAAQPKKDFVTYVFSLARGSIRALVEKRQEKKSVKFRLNSPSGTMGIRGTEILFKHEPSTETSSLYLLEGMADFGKSQCEKINKCIVVKAGNWSFIKKGQDTPSTPQPFAPKDLFGATNGSAENKDSKSPDASLLGLLGMNPESTDVSKIEEKDLKALLEKASEDMKVAQDKLLGRNEALRKAMDAARANGTYDQYMKLAEKYDDLKSKKSRDRSGESFSGALSAKKFALATSILKTGIVKIVEPTAMVTEKTAPLDMKLGSGVGVKSADSGAGKESLDAKLQEANAIAEKLDGLTASSTNTSTATSTSTSTQTTTSAYTKGTDTYYAGAYPTGDSKYYTTQTMDQSAVNQLNAFTQIDPIYTEYKVAYTYYEKCDYFDYQQCNLKGTDGYYREKTGVTTMTETSTITQSENGGGCMKLITTCGKVLQPCDLSQGKYCTPVFKEECKNSYQNIECP